MDAVDPGSFAAFGSACATGPRTRVSPGKVQILLGNVRLVGPVETTSGPGKARDPQRLLSFQFRDDIDAFDM